jgi:hypothetical protein
VLITGYFVAVGSALAALLLIAGGSLPEPPCELSRSAGHHREGAHPDHIRAEMAGSGRPGYQSADVLANADRNSAGRAAGRTSA